jgi:hypothetical protein
LGSGFGQDASTAKVGTSPAEAEREDNDAPKRVAKQKMIAARAMVRMASSRVFACG